jgi:hypothetical protein
MPLSIVNGKEEEKVFRTKSSLFQAAGSRNGNKGKGSTVPQLKSTIRGNYSMFVHFILIRFQGGKLLDRVLLPRSNLLRIGILDLLIIKAGKL